VPVFFIVFFEGAGACVFLKTRGDGLQVTIPFLCCKAGGLRACVIRLNFFCFLLLQMKLLRLFIGFAVHVLFIRSCYVLGLCSLLEGDPPSYSVCLSAVPSGFSVFLLGLVFFSDPAGKSLLPVPYEW